MNLSAKVRVGGAGETEAYSASPMRRLNHSHAGSPAGISSWVFGPKRKEIRLPKSVKAQPAPPSGPKSSRNYSKVFSCARMGASFEKTQLPAAWSRW